MGMTISCGGVNTYVMCQECGLFAIVYEFDVGGDKKELNTFDHERIHLGCAIIPYSMQ